MYIFQSRMQVITNSIVTHSSKTVFPLQCKPAYEKYNDATSEIEVLAYTKSCQNSNIYRQAHGTCISLSGHIKVCTQTSGARCIPGLSLNHCNFCDLHQHSFIIKVEAQLNQQE
ncbi:uncharacterized protein A4U43_C01F3550 [Asparagus officinalis]|uniref:Uncharacterized protein n=1 Tax=Asparagus officinalis TaxID=4686 RepID=A0A5P1FR25_ASPOF|nr:uncharacterized protein A4U43_C01F3550 [Asparagus officinalis]